MFLPHGERLCNLDHKQELTLTLKERGIISSLTHLVVSPFFVSFFKKSSFYLIVLLLTLLQMFRTFFLYSPSHQAPAPCWPCLYAYMFFG